VVNDLVVLEEEPESRNEKNGCVYFGFAIFHLIKIIRNFTQV